MACLYVAFSYVGCEISYPLKVRPVNTSITVVLSSFSAMTCCSQQKKH